MSTLLAYFDPGPGSLLVQSIVGGTAGLIVFGKYLWNSARGNLRSHNRKTRRSDEPQVSSDSSGEIPLVPLK
jgi:hypothetical protein